jgi:hypothetical protein
MYWPELQVVLLSGLGQIAFGGQFKQRPLYWPVDETYSVPVEQVVVAVRDAAWLLAGEFWFPFPSEA